MFRRRTSGAGLQFLSTETKAKDEGNLNDSFEDLSIGYSGNDDGMEDGVDLLVLDSKSEEEYSEELFSSGSDEGISSDSDKVSHCAVMHANPPSRNAFQLAMKRGRKRLLSTDSESEGKETANVRDVHYICLASDTESEAGTDGELWNMEDNEVQVIRESPLPHTHSHKSYDDCKV